MRKQERERDFSPRNKDIKMFGLIGLGLLALCVFKAPRMVEYVIMPICMGIPFSVLMWFFYSLIHLQFLTWGCFKLSVIIGYILGVLLGKIFMK